MSTWGWLCEVNQLVAGDLDWTTHTYLYKMGWSHWQYSLDLVSLWVSDWTKYGEQTELRFEIYWRIISGPDQESGGKTFMFWKLLISSFIHRHCADKKRTFFVLCDTCVGRGSFFLVLYSHRTYLLQFLVLVINLFICRGALFTPAIHFSILLVRSNLLYVFFFKESSWRSVERKALLLKKKECAIY